MEKERYINPFTDFGFKRLFGEEINKDLLLDFLNELLREQQGEIRDLTYMKTEKFGRTEEERRAIFDIYCENERGEKFLVEMQKAKQSFFKDRSVYYASFPIQEQAQRSDWNYELKAIYTIGILDFVFDDDKHDAGKFRYDVQLSDVETRRVFYDKLTFIYLEMPKFTRTVDQLSTRFEKWLYVLKNLHKLDRLPDSLKEKVFEKVFHVAEIAKMSGEEYHAYEDSLKTYRDLQNSIDTARAEGVDEGMVRGIKQGIGQGIRLTALNGIKAGLPNDIISVMTGLTGEEIDAIRRG